MTARDLTSGSIPRWLLVLGLPTFGSFVMQSAYFLVDLYFVGGLGAASIAGLGISLNTFFIILAVGQTIGIGGLALISQTYGRGERAQVPMIFQQVFWLTLVGGLTMWGVMWLLARPYIGLFTGDAAVFREGVAFFQWYVGAFFTQVFIMTCGMCWRAVGDFLTPMRLMLLSLLLNMALDPLLIYGWGPVPGLGIAGAGMATLLAQGVAVAVYLWLIFRSPRNRLLVVRAPLLVDPAMMRRLLTIGFPAGIRDVMFAGALMLVYYFVQPFGPQASAAVGVGFRIIQTGVMPAVAVGAAVASMVGQNYGAGHHDRAKAAMLWGAGAGLGLLGAEYLALLAAPQFWVSLFTEAPGVLNLGALYLVIGGLILPTSGINIVVIFAAQGLGRTGQTLAAQTVRLSALALLLWGSSLWLELSVRGVFWMATGASLLEGCYMLGVLVYFWRRVLRETEPQAVPGTMSTAPAAAVAD
jgi:putative MATE family efflux protein